MFTALVSLLTSRTARNETAMTGEIGLRGLVLPCRSAASRRRFAAAAARAGLAAVILPARNRKDYEEIPEAASNALRFLWAERIEDVIGGRPRSGERA
jgi:ATP-dependent Lon protease